MVLKGFKLSDDDELPDEQDGCVPVHHRIRAPWIRASLVFFPVSCILGRLPLVPVGNTGTIPYEMWREAADIPGASCDKTKDGKDGCRWWYVNSWAHSWETRPSVLMTRVRAPLEAPVIWKVEWFLWLAVGNSENKLQRLEACVIKHKYDKYAKYTKYAKYVSNKYAIKYTETYAIKYVKYATTFTDMKNMWIKKYAKYVAYAVYVE